MSAPAATGHPTVVHWPARLWIALFIFSGVILLDGLDISMIAVAIPEIQQAFGIDAAMAQWLVSAYILAFADDAVLLIASCFVKGMAAAFTGPAAMSLLTTTFAEGPQRNRAFGIFNLFEASGYSSGLLIGGLLAAIDWRAIFVLPIPIALILLVAALRFLPPDPPRTTPLRLDIGGAATLVAGMLLAVFTMVSAEQAGWASPRTIGGFVVAALLLAVFVVIEGRAADPLVRQGILRNPGLVAANVSAALLYGGAMGFQFLVALYLQNLMGWKPWAMALVLLPAGVMVVAIGPRLAAFVPCYLLMLRIGPEPDLWGVLLPASVLGAWALP